MDTSTAKLLNLKNENNKLQCNAFIEINFAPAELIRESELEKIYAVKLNGEPVYIQLVSLLRIPFNDINSLITLPATGKEWHEWKADWMGRFPNTLTDTPMAVYYYKRKTD